MTIHLPKLNGAGGGNGGGGGSSSFPIIVKNSGSSLPSASSFELNDTFLNTSDKKIYKTVVNGYILSSDYTNDATLDLETGIASNFSVGQYNIPVCVSSNTVYTNWTGNLTFNIHFRINSESLDTNDHSIFETYRGSNGYNKGFCISVKNKKLYLYLTQQQQSPMGIYKSDLLVDYELSEGVEYYLSITKSGTICSSSLSIGGYGTNIITSNSFETENWTETRYGSYIQRYGGSQYFGVFSFGQIYLADTTGNVVTPNTSTLFWDSGTNLTDKTEVADKTNGILYLYKDDELVNIPQKNTISFTNVSASSWVADSTYTDYGYKCELSCSGVTSSMYAMVNFAPTEADSGNYATVCLTGTNTVTIYSKVNDTITIPSIVVMGV